MNILEKIRKVEALIERAANEGERESAIQAKLRLEKHSQSQEIEYTIRTNDIWHKKLFVAICHKYGLHPYRYSRQKYTTAMVKISKDFLDGVVWPEYLRYADILENLIEDVATQMISKIHKDESEVVIEGEIASSRSTTQ
ncbi:hypothetical protein HY641_01795 [Candidatus Woesearchaeota archaeon]|nr:hypothetical protein [Candidatus Woesearchaeota archaeon]